MTNATSTLVTVFGGGGFIGRYVCEFLMQAGARVRVAQRNLRAANIIQPLGRVGQSGAVAADVTNRASVERAVENADAVINLTGVFGRRMPGVHIYGARNVAEAAKSAGAAALVQMSAIGADPDGESEYARTKGEGERAVHKAFKNATIIRPSLVFGPEDALTNRFAAMGRLPVLPVLAARTRFQPVYVRDLAQAIAMAALDPRRYGGKTYEIGGPQAMSMLELNRAIMALSGQSPAVVELPRLAGEALSLLDFLPGAPMSRDQWRMLQKDNVVASGAMGLDAFGIQPTPLAAVAGVWLGRFHRGGKFAGRHAASPAAR